MQNVVVHCLIHKIRLSEDQIVLHKIPPPYVTHKYTMLKSNRFIYLPAQLRMDF